MNLPKFNKDSQFELEQVITLFKREDSDDHIKERFYLESHSVLQVKGKNILSEGKPLTLACLHGLSGFLHGKDNRMMKGFIPKQLLYQDPNLGIKRLIWYRPAGEVHFKFRNEKKLPKSGSVHLPTLVFMAQENELFVYATKVNRPTSKSKLYRAPLLNTNGNGKICLGTTRRQVEQQLPLINELSNVLNFWEEMLFASEFTLGEGDGSRTVSYKQGLIPMIKDLQKSKEEFDNSYLVPTSKTVESLTH